MGETLLVSLQGIGNALLALPLAEALRRKGDRVTLLTLSSRSLAVLAHAPMIAEVIAANEAPYTGRRGRLRLPVDLRRRRLPHDASSRGKRLASRVG